MLHTDDKGKAYIEDMGIEHIVSLKDDAGRDVRYHISPDGMSVETVLRDAELTAVCIVSYPAMASDTDTPRIPEHAHHGLVDYICYRQLANGNAAKQSRAMLFYQSFEQTMRTITPPGRTYEFNNLYAATDIRNVGW